MVELKLSKLGDALNTVVSTADDKPLYTITTPYTWVRRTTTIYKHTLGADGQPTESSEEIARIQWHQMHSSKLIYQGQIEELKTFMPAANRTQTSRVFTGPDGKSYRWKQGWKTTCWLEADIDSETPRVVARLREKGLKTTFEIDPSVEHMVELIIITCCFMMGLLEIQLGLG